MVSDVKPYFPVTENSEVFVKDGDHVGLKCIPEGDPKPTVTWHTPKNIDPNVSRLFSHWYNFLQKKIFSIKPMAVCLVQFTSLCISMIGFGDSL